MRDILLFPKFQNENKIENIRKQCDCLYGIIRPHITVVFPFDDKISDKELVDSVRNLVKNKKGFFVKFEGISYSEDDYIFLNCVEGEENIIRLHDLLYGNLLNKHLSNRIYKPHITLGQKENCNEDIILSDSFECKIDAIYIEKIGENDESIILDKIRLI